MPFTPVEWRVRHRTLSTADHTLLMGILNVTPDSFSDGGRFADPAMAETRHGDAVAAGLALSHAGADIVDVGGESTRPGSTPLPAEEEVDRVVPVVAGLAEEGVVVSIDTRKAVVAAAAIDAGAVVVNDVSALGDAAMAEVCAATEVGVVLMHMKGEPATMQDDPSYDDVVGEVGDYLQERIEIAAAVGIDRSRMCIDPGIGFGKTAGHNLDLLAGLGRLTDIGPPVMVGASRKGFLGHLLEQAGHPAAPGDRDAATGATTALAIGSGAAVIRVHDIAGALQVARTADAIVRRINSGTKGWSAR